MFHLCLQALKKSGPKIQKWEVRETRLEAGEKGHNFTPGTITSHQPLRATTFLIRQQTTQCPLRYPAEPSLVSKKCLQNNWSLQKPSGDECGVVTLEQASGDQSSIPTALSSTRWQCWLFQLCANPWGGTCLRAANQWLNDNNESN